MPAPSPSPVYDLPALASAMCSGEFKSFIADAYRALDGAAWAQLVSDMAAAQNTGTLDILAAILTLPEGRMGFALQMFLETFIPLLAIGLAPLANAYEALSTSRENDGWAYYFLRGLEGWLRADSTRAKLVSQAAIGSTVPSVFLRYGLLIGLEQDRAYFLPFALDLVTTGSPADQEVATRVLGWFGNFDLSELSQAVVGLEAALARTSGPEQESALRSLLMIAKRDPAHDDVGLRTIAFVIPGADANLRQIVAQELGFDTRKVTPALAQAVFDLLAQAEAGETETLGCIDNIVSQNLSGPLADAAHALMDGLLARGVATMKVLDSTVHALRIAETSIRDATIKRWLIAPEPKLFVAVRGLCSGFGEEAPRFELDLSGIDRACAERIARRCCVLLMVFPETVASVLASLLRTGPPAAIPAIEQLLVNPLLLNYWHGPRAYLESQMAGAPAPMVAALMRVFKSHDSYKTEAEAMRGLPELRPSQQHRFLAATKKHEEQVAISKAAQKQSLFADIFPTSLLLYGDSTVYDMHLEPGKVVRQEAQMHTHEFSHELPRVEVIDPFGSWYRSEMLLRDEPEE